MSTQQQKKVTKLQALVKAVNSGDTLVLQHLTKPITKNVSLAFISAPKLARKDDDTEEPFAFAAREYVRKRCIGKTVEFTLEYQSKTGRDFGSIIIMDLSRENIALSLVREGLAEVRSKNDTETQNLHEAQELAKTEKKGIWADEDVKKQNTRVVKSKVNVENVAKNIKGKTINVIVEYVVTGSTFRVTLPTNETVLFTLTGCVAPGFKRDDKQNVKKDEKPAKIAQPFANEALSYVENRLLHRDVSVLVESADKDSLTGTVLKSGVKNIEKEQGPVTLQEELLAAGLAKVADWSIAKTKFADRLKKAEETARKQKLRVWQNYVPPAVTLQEEDKNQFTAKVIEIISGDTLKIKNEKGDEEKITLSSIRAQKFGKKEKKEKKKDKKKEVITLDDAPKKEEKKDAAVFVPEPFAIEARELLRQRVAGKTVTVKVDYRKDFSVSRGKSDKTGTEVRRFCSVLVDGKNVAVDLAAQGYASVVRHQAGEERSSDYDKLCLAESEAKKNKKGIYGAKKNIPSVNFNDLTTKKRGELEDMLKIIKGKKMKAVVERVYNATRFKLLLPNDYLMINFSLFGVGAPSLRPKDSKDPQPYAKEALEFSASTLLMKDIEIVIEEVDKAESFSGEIFVGQQTFAELLVKNGYAFLRKSAQKLKSGPALEKLEKLAKESKKNIWQHEEIFAPKPKEVVQTDKPKTNKAREDKGVPLDVRVTEVINASHFYMQTATSGDIIAKIEEAISNLKLADKAAPAAVKDGDLVFAVFEDGNFYRARVQNSADTKAIKVLFIDFGTSSTIGLSSIRAEVPAEIAKIEPQAKEAQLAFISLHTESYRTEAEAYFRELTQDRDLRAVYEYTEDGAAHYTLSDPEDTASVNSLLVQAGFAFVHVPRYASKNSVFAKTVQELEKDQEYAKKGRFALWEHGDVYGDE